MTGPLWASLPEGWASGQIKNAATVTLGKMLQSTDSGGDVEAPYLRAANVQPDGVLALQDTKSMWFSQLELATLDLRHGDVVVVEGGQGGFGRAAFVAQALDGWGFQNSINRLRPVEAADGRYLAYYLIALRLSGFMHSYCNVVSMPHLTAEKLAAIPIPIPPPDVQEAIADYLDRETARIDTLMQAQQRLIGMLEERRQASTDHVVWSGLDGSPHAGTNVDPAPLAPAHWARRRNKDLLAEAAEISNGGSEELLSVSHLTGITPRSEKNVTMIEAESLDGYRVVKAGDLVINTMWAWMGALGVSRVPGIVSPAYGVYRPHPGVEFHPGYFDYLYRSRPYVVEMTRFSRGIWSSRLRLYPEVFLRLAVVVPPLDEQHRIAAYLDDETKRIDLLISETVRFIELARERRAALITAAVTGQIDVRAGEPAEVA